MTKKRGNSLDTYTEHITDNSYHSKKTKTVIPINENVKSEEIIEKNSIVKQWLGERFKDKLQRASRLSSHTHKPILLYRKSIEESESAIEEEISYISGSHIVQVNYTYGGFIPSNFKNIEVFTVDKFIKWILQEKKRSYFYNVLKNWNNKEKELYIQKRTLAYYSSFIYNVSLLLSYNIYITEKFFI